MVTDTEFEANNLPLRNIRERSRNCISSKRVKVDRDCRTALFASPGRHNSPARGDFPHAQLGL